jgi:conjugative transposon TraN protein
MKILLLLLISSLGLGAKAQDYNPAATAMASRENKIILPISKTAVKGSFPLGICQDKTIHVVFGSAIKEIDAGSNAIIAQVTPSFANVLRIKSTVSTCFEETNLTVITADGSLYSFLCNYMENPEILNLRMESSPWGNMVLPGLSLSQNQIEANCQSILDKENFIKNTGTKNLGIACFVESIHNDKDLTYIKYKINNNSDMDFSREFVKLYVNDNASAKREVSQEEELQIIYEANSKTVDKNATAYFVVCTKRLNVAQSKSLEMEIYENKGARHMRFPISAEIVAKSREL